MIGRTISHYRVVEKLGSGGMGEVYKAEDLRLGRAVALKFLPEELSKDSLALERFRREARAASSLNHPNICTIYEVDQFEGRSFIAMEFLDGETLKQHVAAGALSPDQMLGWALQISEALDTAHSQGIIHRDIKPANIFVTRRGPVKLLDFGLAKLIADREAAAAAAADEGLTGSFRSQATVHGVSGTVAYMSPEQARAEDLDPRSDLFSFGAVLYEMATGRLAFSGRTAAVILNKILEHPPRPPSQVNPRISPKLEEIILKMLEKEREVRCQSAAELRADLKRLQRTSISPSLASGEYAATPSARRPFSRLSLSAAAAAALLLAAAAVWIWFPRSDSPVLPQRVVPLTSFPGREFQAVLSSDGKQVAFVWDGDYLSNEDIYVKLVGSGPPLRLTTDAADDFSPAWSPDGAHVAFVRRMPEGHGLFVVPALGGSERRVGQSLAEGYGFGLDWSPDGKWLAIVDRSSLKEPNGIFLLSIDTGEKRRLTAAPAGSTGDAFPAFSPDGQTLAFISAIEKNKREVFVVPVAGGSPRNLTIGGQAFAGLAWSADGRSVVFSSLFGGKHLGRVWLDGGAQERLPAGGGQPLFPSIARHTSRLVFSEWTENTNIWRIPASPQHGGVAAAAEATRRRAVQLISSTRKQDSPNFSFDGKKIAFASDRSGTPEIWVCDSEGANATQLTSLGGPVTGTPRWSPDGQRLAFDSRPEGHADILVIGAQGGLPRRLTQDPAEDNVPSWSRDGRWIYFTSNRSSDWQIWKMPAEGGPAVRVTRGGGFEPIESSDGKDVYYTKSGTAGIWRVPAQGGDESLVVDQFQAGARRYWAVVPHGLYFATDTNSGGGAIRFYSFATRQATLVATMEQGTVGGPAGLAVSPDGRWILYTQHDRRGSDLMLIENFR